MTRSLLDAPAAVLLGQRAPRIRHVPPAVSSGGPEAIDLLRSTGQEADPWQGDAAGDILAEDAFGQAAARRTYTIVPRQNGKGGIIEPIELYGLFVLHEVILHSAHLFDTARDAFQRILALIQNTADLDRRVLRVNQAHGKEGIELRPRPAVFGGDGMLYDRGGPGGKLYFHARTKGGGRGKSPRRLILDEAFALTRDQLAALLYAISAQSDPQINHFSTPPPVGEPCELLMAVRAGVLAAIKAGEAPRVTWLEWGVEHGADVTKPETWAKANPAYGIRITEKGCRDELDLALNGGGLDEFGRERCGIWPLMGEAQWLVIPEVDWRAAADPTTERGDGRPAFCLEMAPDRSWSAILAAWFRPDGLRQIHINDHRPGTGWFVPRVLELQKHDPCAVVVARDSPAVSEIPALEKAGVDVVLMSGPDAVAGAGILYDGVAGDVSDPEAQSPRTVRHSGQEPLDSGVAAAVKRPPEAKAWSWDRARPGSYLIIGATGALWGLATRGHLESVPLEPLFARA